MSFQVAPAPTGPSRSSLLPTAESAGRAASKVAGPPPAKNLRSPDSAALRLPPTGASRKRHPCASTLRASSRTQPGVSVLDSMTMAPRFAPASAPSAPSQTEREAASSATMAKMKSAPAAASRGVAATLAPLSASASALAAVRLKTESAKPLASQFEAMPAPMIPRPISAMRCMNILLQDRLIGRFLSNAHARDAGSKHVRTVASALRGFPEFLDHPVALELGDVIDEQNAVEMVDLVLEHGREQALSQGFARLSLSVEGADAHRRRALDLGVIFRNGKAALLIGRALFSRPYDLGIDERLGVGRFLLFGDVDHQEPDRLGDLDRR